MNQSEYKCLNSVNTDVFFDKCVELWREEGAPLVEGMAELLLEEYNNAACNYFIREQEQELTE